MTDDFTKIYGKHTFKMGFEWQHVKFSTLQPPWSRGEFDFDGVYTDIPSASPVGNTGSRQFLLTPALAPWEGSIMSGGPGAQNWQQRIRVQHLADRQRKELLRQLYQGRLEGYSQADREPWLALGFLRAGL